MKGSKHFNKPKKAAKNLTTKLPFHITLTLTAQPHHPDDKENLFMSSWHAKKKKKNGRGGAGGFGKIVRTSGKILATPLIFGIFSAYRINKMK